MTGNRVLLLTLLVAACANPQTASHKVLLVPIGAVSADVLVHLQRELPAIVAGEVLIGARIPAPVAALDRSRKQYLGEGLLRELERLDGNRADRVVGIIDEDAFAPGLNFIFGQARKPGRVAVVALPRLRQSLRGRPDGAERFRSRALKVTVHELGHTFDYAHCPDRLCVMHFANSIGEADAGGSRYCSRER